MTLPCAADLLAFAAAAALVTIVPGLDTALVLRTAIAEGARRALLAGTGIALGCLAWGLVIAAGLGALLESSEFAYSALRLLGACYLFYLGCRLMWSPRRKFALGGVRGGGGPDFHWLVRGLLTNILNPKVGIFYVSFLPQFIPARSDVAPSAILLAAMHAGLGLAWFCVLVAATGPIARALRRSSVIAWLDRVTGGTFVLFGVRLAASSHR